MFTATVIGAMAYGPPRMAQDWLRTRAGIDGASANLTFDFWPNHRPTDGKRCQPDVIVVDRSSRKVLVIEAKRDSHPRSGQLIREGKAATSIHPKMMLHLLTISDRPLRPAAFVAVRRREPALFATMEHVTWADLYAFLKGWSERDGVDAGHQRMLGDAMAVLEDHGRDSFRGLGKEEVRAMARDVRWMYDLPVELMKLHRNLERTLGQLRPPLHAIGTDVYTDIIPSVSYNNPQRWFPRHFTLRYGGDSERYFFVRAVLDSPAIWVGYAPKRADVRGLLADRVALERFLKRRDTQPVRVVGVTARGSHFEVFAGPLKLSADSIREVAGDRRVQRLNFIRAFPMSVVTRPGAEATLESALRGVVMACRSAKVLGAP